MQYLSAQDVKPFFSEKEEVAFIDVREVAEYGKGHPFFVSHVPYSILEARITDYVPCFKTKTILIDGDDGTAEKASKHLEALGYENITIVEGGIKAWSAAGYALYEGISAPSKSFGEVVEHSLGTPSITATELKKKMDRGDDFLLLDGRTPQEFNRMTIPGSTSCPNAELSLRYKEMLKKPDMDIIINCAGRTRSLVGAQTLRTLGIKNNVYALENGTMGWKLAGLELEYGATRKYPEIISDDVIKEAKIKAGQLIKKYSIELIDHKKLKEWQSDQNRTTFLFDIRTQEEFDSGHVKGAFHAPGGQLVQATDQWFATRNARIVVYDNHRIRAVMTSIWLKGMGHDAVVLDEDTVSELVQDKCEGKRYSECEVISLDQLGEAVKKTTIIDVRSSQNYRDSHIENAIWGVRPKITTLELKGDITLVADDIVKADLVSKELPNNNVSISLTTNDDWNSAGIKVISTPNFPPDEDRIDFLFHTHDRHSGNMDHAREYLRWETGLLDQMDDQEKATLNPLK